MRLYSKDKEVQRQKWWRYQRDLCEALDVRFELPLGTIHGVFLEVDDILDGWGTYDAIKDTVRHELSIGVPCEVYKEKPEWDEKKCASYFKSKKAERLRKEILTRPKWEYFTNFLTDWFIKQEFLGILHDEKEKIHD